MARRRAPRGVGGGAFGGVTQLMLPILMQDRLMRRRQAEDDARAAAQRLAASRWNTAAGLIPDVSSGKLRAENIPQEMRDELPFDLSAFAPSEEQRASGVVGKIGAMRSPADLTEQGVLGELAGAGVDMTPGIGRVSMEETEDTLPSQHFVPESNRIVGGALGALKEKQDALIAEDRATNLVERKSFDPNSLTHFSAMVPRRDAASQGGLQQEPTPEQAGQIQLQTALAGPLSREYSVAEANAKNMVEVLTREERAQSAADISAATAGGQFDAIHDPGRMDTEVEFQRRLAEARHQATGGGTQTTEGERRAAMNLVPLLNSHSKALALEKGDTLRGGEGARISPMMINAASSPAFDWATSWMFSENERNYMQAAIDYANTYGYIRSGVTVRSDEFPRYLSNLFALSQDTPAIVQQKQQARDVFNASMQISMGRSKFEGGAALGQAIKMGIINPEIINTITMDPEFQRGVMSKIQIGGAR